MCGVQIKSEVNVLKLTLSAKVVAPEKTAKADQGSEASTPLRTPPATLTDAKTLDQGANPGSAETQEFSLDENRTLRSILGQDEKQA